MPVQDPRKWRVCEKCGDAFVSGINPNRDKNTMCVACRPIKKRKKRSKLFPNQKEKKR